MNNFAQAVNYLASAIDMVTKNLSTSSQQISNSQTSKGQHSGFNRGGGQNQGQHERGCGRGGRYHRGGRRDRSRGRGRGRGCDGNGSQSDQPGQNRSLTRGYSHEEWQSMSQSQRNRIYREKECVETARTVAAMLRED